MYKPHTLKTCPLCPILWYLVMGALILHTSSRLLPDEALNIIWFQKKKPKLINKRCSISRALLHLSLKSPGLCTPSRFLIGGPYGQSYQFPEPSFTPLEFLNKSSIKRNFTLLSKALAKECPHHVPQNRSTMETDPNFQSSTIKVPSLWSPFQVPQRDPYGERFPSPEPSFTYPSGSPVKEPSF